MGGMLSPTRRGPTGEEWWEEASAWTVGSVEVDVEGLKKRAKLAGLLMEEIEREQLPEAVYRSFQADFNSSSQLTEEIFKEYKRYMVLRTVCGGEGACSQVLRVAQQYHAAETQAYESFCIKFFG